MIDSAGPLQRLALSRTLWTIGAPPLLALAWHVAVDRRRAARTGHEGEVAWAAAWARGVGIASLLLATAATVAHEALLARSPDGAGALFDPLVRCARIGQLDVGIDLWFDRLSAVACCIVCIVGLGASGMLARRPPGPGDWRAWACLELFVSGALLSSIADGFVTTAMGWALVVAAATWLVSWMDGRAAVVTATRGAAGIVALAIAASLLFWGLGGAWWDAGYAAEPGPRFVTARSDEEAMVSPRRPADDEAEEPGPGWLTLTSMPGASVFVDEARTPALRAPFVRAELPAGSHVLRIHPGGSAEDAVVGPFTLGSGDAIALVQLGPTLSFREIAAQLASWKGAESDGRRALADRSSPFGAHVVGCALMVLALAAGVMSASGPPREVPLALGVASRVIALVPGPLLLARLVVLAPLVHEVRSVWAIPALGAATLLVAVGLSRRRPGLHGLLFYGVPERVGALAASFERWVIEAAAGAAAGVVRVAAWLAARFDVDAIGSPADIAAARVVRAGHVAEGLIGQPLGRAAWALVAILAAAVLAHAVAPLR